MPSSASFSPDPERPVGRASPLPAIGPPICGQRIPRGALFCRWFLLPSADDRARPGEPADGPALGVLAAAAACGTLAASRALGPLQRRLGVGVIAITALALQAALTAAWAAVASLVAAVLVLAAWQAATSTLSLSGIVVRQSVTPAHLQGRVNTTARMVAWGGQPIGAALGGVLAEAMGIRAAILITGMGVVASLVGATASGLRHAPRLADLTVPVAGSEAATT